MLISKPILFESDDLEKFDKIVGHNKRSEQIRTLVINFIQEHKDGQTHGSEEQFKLEEKE